MSSPIIAPPLSGQVVGSGNDCFVVAEWSDGGAPAGPPRLIAPLHLHRHDDEAWYVLDGTLRVQVGADEIEAGPGSAVFVPRGTPHTYWNPDTKPVRYLLVMTANIYRLIQEIHATKDRTPSALQKVFERYDSELIGASRSG
jgi:mannose-6-phosphate isomerase-like protein (cupin superfamily)